MEFLLRPSVNGKIKSVTMAHNGEELDWIIELYRKFKADHFVFGDINRLLAELPKEKQDILWNAYKQIHEDFINIHNPDRLMNRIRDNLKVISDTFPYRTVLKDVVAKDTIWTPPEREDTRMPLSRIAQNTDQAEKNQKSLSLTYDKHDYHGLNSLIIYSKLYMPVLAHYYTLIGDDVLDFFRCMKTVSLLDKTEFIHEQGYQRLREFIVRFWSGKSDYELAPPILVHGLAKDGAVDWIMADVFMKKLLPIGVSHKYENLEPSQRPSLISSLFYYVQGDAEFLTKGRDGRGGSSEFFMNKDAPGKTDEGEENQASTLERYKIAGEMSEMNLVINNHFLSDVANIIPHLDPTLSIEQVEAIEYDKDYHKSYHPFRATLMKWLMASAVSPKYIEYLSSVKHGPGVQVQQGVQYRNCFRVCMALLKHWGFDELARIFDGRLLRDIQPEPIFDTTDVTADQLKQISEFYPHTITSNRVKGESRRSSSYPILACIKMEDDVRGAWFEGVNYEGRWCNRYHVKYILVELLIYMNKHQLINP